MKRLNFVLLILSLILMSLTIISSKCLSRHVYDVFGMWTLNYDDDDITWAKLVTNNKLSSKKLSATSCWISFSGDETSGTFIDEYGHTGTWSQHSNDVTWTYDCCKITFSGTLEDDNHMSGEWVDEDHGKKGTWSATRMEEE